VESSGFPALRGFVEEVLRFPRFPVDSAGFGQRNATCAQTLRALGQWHHA
jgi:hypothetical protein